MIYKYLYFISYSYSRGFGNCKVDVSAKIDNYEIIEAIQDRIAQDKRISGVIIVNFQLLSCEE